MKHLNHLVAVQLSGCHLLITVAFAVRLSVGFGFGFGAKAYGS